jgi:hypothetical protein
VDTGFRIESGAFICHLCLLFSTGAADMAIDAIDKQKLPDALAAAIVFVRLEHRSSQFPAEEKWREASFECSC